MTQSIAYDRELDLLKQIEKLSKENCELKAERNKWYARAMAMFWKLPDNVTIGELNHDSSMALNIIEKIT